MRHSHGGKEFWSGLELSARLLGEAFNLHWEGCCQPNDNSQAGFGVQFIASNVSVAEESPLQEPFLF
jgi:hypothetical protein